MVSQGVRWSVWAALAFGVATIPIMVPFGLFLGPGPTTAVIPVSAMLTGGVVWFLLIERREAISVKSGAIAGAVTGLLAHIVYWLLLHLPLLVYVALFTSAATTREGQQTLIETFATVPALILVGIILTGWLSVPLGAIAGAGVGYRRDQHE